MRTSSKKLLALLGLAISYLSSPSTAALAQQIPTEIEWVTQDYSPANGPGWEVRWDANCAEFNTPLSIRTRKTVIMQGGQVTDGTTRSVFKDTFISTDHGSTWKKTNDGTGTNGPASAGGGLALLSSKKLIQYGGFESDPSSPNNKVWWSANQGQTWNRVTSTIPWSPRAYFADVTIPSSNIVIIIGGRANEVLYNDVYLTFDGKGQQWTQRTTVPFAKRFRHAATVVGDIAIGSTIIVTGGADNNGNLFNDVYTSSDLGTSWILVNSQPGFFGRQGANLVNYGSAVYLFNGMSLFDGSTDFGPHAVVNEDLGIALFSDTWLTTDNGKTWSQNPPNIGLTLRYAACASMTMPGQVATFSGTQDELSGVNSVQIANLYNGTRASALPGWQSLAKLFFNTIFAQPQSP